MMQVRVKVGRQGFGQSHTADRGPTTCTSYGAKQASNVQHQQPALPFPPKAILVSRLFCASIHAYRPPELVH